MSALQTKQSNCYFLNLPTIGIKYYYMYALFTYHFCPQASRIIAKLACYSKERMGAADLKFYFTWLKQQLTAPSNQYVQTVAESLQQMLRLNEYRVAFMENEGMST